MKQNSFESRPADRSGQSRRVAFVIVVFFLLMSVPVILNGVAGTYGPHLTQVDIVFCTLTFTNCTPHSLFEDVMTWSTMFVLNGIAFGVWLLYAFSVRSFVAGKARWSRWAGGFLSVLIPLGMSMFGAAVFLLQGLRS